MTLHELEVRVSLFEAFLNLRMLNVPDRPLDRAIREIYATRSAVGVASWVRTFFSPGTEIPFGLTDMPNEVASDHNMAREQFRTDYVSGMRINLPNPAVVHTAAFELYEAVSMCEPERATRTLVKMGVLALCVPPALQFGRLELSVAAVIGKARLIPMVELAVFAAEQGVLDRAAAYLMEARAASPGPPQLHDLHVVAGILALHDGKIEVACENLSASVRVCQNAGFLMSRGPTPNLMLARKLLDLGDRTVVVDYLTKCQRLWKNCADAIAEWIRAIQKGPQPANEPDLLTTLNRRMATLKVLALTSMGTLGPLDLNREEVDALGLESKREATAAIRGRLDNRKN